MDLREVGCDSVISFDSDYSSKIRTFKNHHLRPIYDTGRCCWLSVSSESDLSICLATFVGSYGA